LATVRKAIIHHKDGNSLNNDSGNWRVLCSKCHASHRKKTNEIGFYIAVMFKPWLREKILQAAGHRCQVCSAQVGDKKHKRCNWCRRITTKANRVEWQDGRTMCRECFDDWTKKGRPAEFSYQAVGKKIIR